MHAKKYLLLSLVSFILATCSFWLPALLYILGAGNSLLKASQQLAEANSIFTSLGIGLLILSIYHYRLEKIRKVHKQS